MTYMHKITTLIIACVLGQTVFSQPGTSWTNSGPVQFPSNISGQINGIGRCTQIKFDPINPNKIYATSASGGLWTSDNNGDSWYNLGTDFFYAMQCASICIDYTSNSTLYLGSGDPNYYGGGNGIYKSTNGGTTWSLSNTGITTGLIVEIIMDPTDHLNLLAATDNGIFKSTNAGLNWTNVKSGGDFKAMKLKPGSNDTLYSVTSSEIYRSVDFGGTWQQLTNGVTIPGGNGQGMRIAVSPADPNTVYIGMIADEGTILKSTDGGDNFTTVYDNPAQSLVGYDASSSGQGDYNFAMTCDPTDANIVYVAAHVVWKSIDGGINWTQMTDWWAKCHTDMHGIAFHPNYPTQLFDVNDGGVFISTDGGANWTPKANGVAATEIYHASQSMLQRDIVSIGTQDNGELYQSQTNWITNRGGDWGSKSTFSYNSPNVVYYYENGNRRTVTGSESSCNFPFTTSNSMSLEFNRALPNIAVSALTEVYLCNDITASTPAWTQLGTLTPSTNVMALHSSVADSSVVYAIGNNNKIYRCDNIFTASPTFQSFSTPSSTNVAASIATVPTDPNIVYITCGTHVYRSANKGQTFTSFSTGLPTTINIIKIYVDEFSTDETIYLCMAKGVYYRNNSMSSWQNISYNLPTIADIQDFMFYNPGNAGALLRVGYYGRGVWELPVNTTAPPTVDFLADQLSVCPTIPIHFTDQSYSSGTITNWLWSFPGGTPSTSTNQNPTVTYAASGNYSVSLQVTDQNGNASTTKTTYITITSSNTIPQYQTFEGTFLPTEWSFYDDGNDGVNWSQNSTVGGNGNSSKSTFFDNYDNDVSGKRDEIRTPNFDLTEVLTPTLTFDVAFARYGASNIDTLVVLATTDCGLTFTEIYNKGNTDLATAPDDQNLFVPTASQWRNESIDLSSFIGQTGVMFAFQNRGHYGNAIYLDNINVNGVSTAGIPSVSPASFDFSIYPNPATEKIQLSIQSNKKENYIVTIVDIAGKTVITSKISTISGTGNQSIDIRSIAKGIYTVQIDNGKDQFSKKLVIE